MNWNSAEPGNPVESRLTMVLVVLWRAGPVGVGTGNCCGPLFHSPGVPWHASRASRFLRTVSFLVPGAGRVQDPIAMKSCTICQSECFYYLNAFPLITGLL